jgi:small acid-soluble spore protein F (minor alpha/beta-type SASP)
MTNMSRNNQLVNPKAANAMDHLKAEVAQELGLNDDIQQRGWENMTTREVGKIGGNMVRKMISFAEQEMARRNGQITQSTSPSAENDDQLS